MEGYVQLSGVLIESKKGVRPLGARVIYGCELLNEATGNQTLVPMQK